MEYILIFLAEQQEEQTLLQRVGTGGAMGQTWGPITGIMHN